MKRNLNRIVWFLCVCFFMSANGVADPFAPPQLIKTTPSHVFKPMGFDDNDNSQVILHGVYPDTCYKVGGTEISVDQAKKEVLVTNLTYHYVDTFCLMVLVPYTKTVDLGVLAAGQYNIMLAQPDGSVEPRGILPVAVSLNNGPDDFLYAPVSEAYLDTTVAGSEPVVVLKGTFSNKCMVMKETKVFVRAGNVVEVLPVAEMLKDNCGNQPTPFETRVKIHAAPSGKTLIHVRTLNGSSVNKVVDF